MDFDDPTTLAKLKAGDNVIFAAMVREFHSTLTTVARSIIGEALADEVVQESWLMAHNALPKFEGRSKVKSWLFTIVSNHAKTRLRKESRSVSLEGLSDAEDPLAGRFVANGHWANPIATWHMDSPDQLLEQAQLQTCIDHTLTQLPPAQKAVFILRDIEQMPLEEICNTLDIKDSNVRVLLHRARLKLFKVIAHYQETGEC